MRINGGSIHAQERRATGREISQVGKNRVGGVLRARLHIGIHLFSFEHLIREATDLARYARVICECVRGRRHGTVTATAACRVKSGANGRSGRRTARVAVAVARATRSASTLTKAMAMRACPMVPGASSSPASAARRCRRLTRPPGFSRRCASRPLPLPLHGGLAEHSFTRPRIFGTSDGVGRRSGTQRQQLDEYMTGCALGGLPLRRFPLETLHSRAVRYPGQPQALKNMLGKC